MNHATVALPHSRIDRDSPVPFYFQLKKLLADEITSGRWGPGDRLPSEHAICSHFDISRTTVRQAFAELESEQMVRREKGRGAFVAEQRPPRWLVQSSHGFFDEATRTGHKVTSRVLRGEVGPLPHWAVDALQLTPGSEGLILERLRSLDNQLVTYTISYMLAELADAVLTADLEMGSVYRILEERRGVTVAGGRNTVEALVAQGELASLLEVEQGAPLLFTEGVAWGADLRPFECNRSWHRADCNKIEVQVVPVSAGERSWVEHMTS